MPSTVIAKSGIELEKNKKKSRSSSSFSLLAALSDFDGPLEDLTDHDKKILCETDPLFEKPRRILSCQPTPSKAMETAQDKPSQSPCYHPTVWDPQLIESIHSSYAAAHVHGESNARIEELKLEVKCLFRDLGDPMAKLELIDTIQHLGVAYHFSEEIDVALSSIHKNELEYSLYGLHETALGFRLLRQHGYNVPSDVAFNKFRDGDGFMNCLTHDIKGLLRLYEATQLALPGEKILEEAKEFSVGHLHCLSEDVDFNLVEQVKHSLDAPSHWLMPRLEARRYIDVYEREEGKMSCLLELAKLDFNVVQALYQKEVKELSRWWQELCLIEKLKFPRDRLFESYLVATEVAFEPQLSMCRKVLTKFICIFSVIDDCYDMHSSLEEAKLFTSAVQSWDLNAMETLPDYFKLCYLVLDNFVNETTYYFLMDFGWDIAHFLKREWIRLYEAYLIEAEWFCKGITPSLDEYLKNGLISIGGLLLSAHLYYLVGANVIDESLDWLEKGFRLAYWFTVIGRLTDDLALSKAEMHKEGAPSAIPCRMKDSGESYETAREFVEDLVSSAWKHLNEESLDNTLPRNFVKTIMNGARVAFCLCQQGDAFGTSTGITKDKIKSLFVEPIPME